MIEAVVVDIEGTVGPISFVREVLFPWARPRLRGYVTAHRRERAVEEVLAGARQLLGEPDAPDGAAIAALERWSDEDRKAPPLKALQGLVWEEGFRGGELRGRLYPDVAPVLRRWHGLGARLFVYSSGSVQAQRSYFRSSDAGDLTPLFEGFFDTTVGPKVEPASYRAIAAAVRLPPARILFLSDSAAELDAAVAAGVRAVAVAREGAAPAAPHAAVASLHEIDVPMQLLRLVQKVAARGWVFATSGNFSARLGDGRVSITASGVDKSELELGDLVSVDLEGGAAEAGRRPSAEMPLHLALYRRSGRIGAVGHTHSLAATVLSRRFLSEGVLRLTGYEMAKALEGVRSHEETLVLPVVPNSQDMNALAAAIDARLSEWPGARGYLVAGHGLTTWAPDVAALGRHLEALEHLLACELAALG